MQGLLNLLLTLLPVLLGNPTLQHLAADPVAKLLSASLPQADDAAIASFLELLATELRAAPQTAAVKLSAAPAASQIEAAKALGLVTAAPAPQPPRA